MDEDKRRRTEITIETISVTRIRTHSTGRREIYCKTCGQNVAPLEEVRASSADDGEPEKIVEMCPDGKIHRLADSDISGNSVVKYLEEKK